MRETYEAADSGDLSSHAPCGAFWVGARPQSSITRALPAQRVAACVALSDQSNGTVEPRNGGMNVSPGTRLRRLRERALLW